jgi:hypothetical protein
MQVVYGFFDGADVACIDPARFFYSNAKLQDEPDNLHVADGVLPLLELRRYLKQMQILEKRAQQAAAQTVKNYSGPQNATVYAAAALQSEVQALATTQQGGRNHQLNRAALNVGTLIGAGALTETDVTPALIAAARQAGLPESEINKTLASGLRAGIQNPRAIQ